MSDTTILNGQPQQTTVKFVSSATVIKNVTAETVVKFVPNQAVIKNVTSETVVKVTMAGMSLAMFAALFEAYIASLPRSDSDENSGLPENGVYITQNHVQAPGGLIKLVEE